MAPPCLRLVLDQGVPRDAVEILKASGVDCIHVGALGLSKAEDTEILEWARTNDAVIVTLDADFHMILAVRNASNPSVVRIRQQGLDARAIAELVINICQRFESELLRGCMVTVKPRKSTCRMLPLMPG